MSFLPVERIGDRRNRSFSLVLFYSSTIYCLSKPRWPGHSLVFFHLFYVLILHCKLTRTVSSELFTDVITIQNSYSIDFP